MELWELQEDGRGRGMDRFVSTSFFSRWNCVVWWALRERGKGDMGWEMQADATGSFYLLRRTPAAAATRSTIRRLREIAEV